MKLLIIFAILSIIIDSPVAANDTMASLDGSGIRFEKSQDISVESEDLYISPTKIKVAYVFINESNERILATMAFPLPRLITEIDLENIPIQIPKQSENFVDFSVRANGELVEYKVLNKAFCEGKDITARLNALSIPISPLAENHQSAINHLSSEIKDDLLKDDCLFPMDMDGKVLSRWETQTIFYWQQLFPPGEKVKIEHQYIPVVGGNYGDAESLLRQNRVSHCIDKYTEKGIYKMANSEDSLTYAWKLAYLLTPAANWKGPVKDFRLTLDKADPENIISVCFDGFKKTSPTTFSAQYINFEPDKDLEMLIISKKPL